MPTILSSLAASIFTPAFVQAVKDGLFYIVFWDWDICNGEEPAEPRLLSIRDLNNYAEAVEHDNKKYNMKIPTGLEGEKAIWEISESFGVDGGCRVFTKEMHIANQAKQFDAYVSSLKLPNNPGSPEWFNALQARIDSERGEVSGERLMERACEMRMGAQSEEGFYSDNDYARVQASKLSEVMDWAMENMPMSYAIWQENLKK